MPAAETLIRKLLEKGDIAVGGDRPQDIKVYDPRFYQRAIANGALGVGESYMDGWWEAVRLDAFFHHVTRARLEEQLPTPGRWWAVLWAFLTNQQSRRRSRRVAETHYDIGNDFYFDMLGPWMQYTCAYWREAKTLQEAQEAKLDLICRKLGLRAGHRVLELGGGWGGFAKFAAERYGCEVTLYNISEQQTAYAREFCRGLPVTVRRRDYREAEGLYDRVVSIGLCEHVGDRNYGAFYELQRRCVREDGLVLTHTIGRRTPSRSCNPWFRKYIFPGGLLPCLSRLADAAQGRFIIEDLHNLGADYDPTLMAWHANFAEAWPRYQARFGERFERMWRFYLLSCAGAFRARDLQLWQLVFSPKGVPGGYQAVR